MVILFYISTFSISSIKLISIDLEAAASTSKPPSSIQAITNAIEAVFGTASNKIPKKPTKRTVVKRSDGQIITEKAVIEQLEERKQKQNSKRSRSNNQTTSTASPKKKAKKW